MNKELSELKEMALLARQVNAGKKVYKKFFRNTENGIIFELDKDAEFGQIDYFAFDQCKGELFEERHRKKVLVSVEKYIEKKVRKNQTLTNQLVERQFKKGTILAVFQFQQCLGEVAISYKEMTKTE